MNLARCLAASLCVVTSMVATAQPRDWQQSTETQTVMWVRDKSEGMAFKVTFRVIKPDGGVVIANAASGADGSATATFPKSFGLYGPMAHGTYHWEALSNGNVVASDDFSR